MRWYKKKRRGFRGRVRKRLKKRIIRRAKQLMRIGYRM